MRICILDPLRSLWCLLWKAGSVRVLVVVAVVVVVGRTWRRKKCGPLIPVSLQLIDTHIEGTKWFTCICVVRSSRTTPTVTLEI
jgi:hypothetical protein